MFRSSETSFGAMSSESDDDTPLDTLLSWIPKTHFGEASDANSMSISSVGPNDSLVPESQLVEALTRAFGKLRAVQKECALVYPDEVHRLLVFGPRLYPFSHRDVCSIRHPRTSCVAWRKKIAFGAAKASRLEKLSALDSMNGLLPEEAEKWKELAVLHETITPKVVPVQRAREALSDDLSISKAISRLWIRATGTLTTDGVFMNQQQYCLFESRLYAQLFDRQSILDALDPIEKDYIYDSMVTKQGGTDREGVSFEAFTSSMMELADNWTATGSPTEYAALLYDLLVQVFAPQWSADADAAFQVFLSRKVIAPRAVLRGAAEARRGNRLYLASSDANDATSVMQLAAEQAKAAVESLLNSVAPPVSKTEDASVRPPKPPKPISGAPHSSRPRAQVKQARTPSLAPPQAALPITVQSLIDTDQYYPHREAQLTRSERQLRAQVRLKLRHASPSPLYVAVKSKILALSAAHESDHEVTDRISREHFGVRSLAVQTARWRSLSHARAPLAPLPFSVVPPKGDI